MGTGREITLTRLEPGEKVLKITASGFRPLVQKVKLAAGRSVELVLSLRGLAPLYRPVFEAVFRWRHRSLRRMFGEAAG